MKKVPSVTKIFGRRVARQTLPHISVGNSRPDMNPLILIHQFYEVMVAGIPDKNQIDVEHLPFSLQEESFCGEASDEYWFLQEESSTTPTTALLFHLLADNLVTNIYGSSTVCLVGIFKIILHIIRVSFGARRKFHKDR